MTLSIKFNKKDILDMKEMMLFGLSVLGQTYTHDLINVYFFTYGQCRRYLLDNTFVFVLGLFYDTVNNEIGAEMAYLEANKLNQAAAVAEARAIRDEEIARERAARGEPEHDERGMSSCSRRQFAYIATILFLNAIAQILLLAR